VVREENRAHTTKNKLARARRLANPGQGRSRKTHTEARPARGESLRNVSGVGGNSGILAGLWPGFPVSLRHVWPRIPVTLTAVRPDLTSHSRRTYVTLGLVCRRTYDPFASFSRCTYVGFEAIPSVLTSGSGEKIRPTRRKATSLVQSD
jgi:hypothetical protein